MALIRRGGAQGQWIEPDVTRYRREQELQDLLVASPGLLHGVDGLRAVAVEELAVGARRLDVVVIDDEGSITIVECKLDANPESKRSIVGQILSYAAGLADLTVDELLVLWVGADRQELEAALAQKLAESGLDFDRARWRRGLTESLRTGRFRLVLAVDRITDELRQIVEFLSRKTVADLEIVCMEFDHATHGDLEILIPTTFGADAADRKAAVVARHTETAFRSAVLSLPVDQQAAVEALLDQAVRHPRAHSVYWGEGSNPSCTPWFELKNGARIQPWTFTTRPQGQSRWTINWQFMDPIHSVVELERFAAEVGTLPGVGRLVEEAAAASWRKRPSLPAASFLNTPVAVDVFSAALAEFLG